MRNLAFFVFTSATFAIFVEACQWGGQTYWLHKYDREIEDATHAIKNAPSDALRAQGYSQRGRGYSEKARYSKTFKLIPPDEYDRLFTLAIADHDRAVDLAPDNAQVHFDRGMTYYDRAALEAGTEPNRAVLFSSARDDFSSAIDRDAKNENAFDMRGLVLVQAGQYDEAIRDFSQEMALNLRAGRLRLAETYCERGLSRGGKKEIDAAIADLEKSIEFDVKSDGCSCQSHSPLVALYIEKEQYAKARLVVEHAKKANEWIAPELIEKLTRVSGSNPGHSTANSPGKTTPALPKKQ